MGQNDGEIFSKLREIGESVVQLDGLDFARQFTRDEIARNYAIDKARFGLP